MTNDKDAELRVAIANFDKKYRAPKGGFNKIGKRKLSLVLNQLLDRIQALEKVTAKRPRGRPKKVVEVENA